MTVILWKRFNLICRRAFQPVRDRAPFLRVGRRFHHDQFRARFVALMQLGVQRPRKSLCVVRHDTDPAEAFRGRNPRVGDHVTTCEVRDVGKCQVRGVRCQCWRKSASSFQVSTINLAFGA